MLLKNFERCDKQIKKSKYAKYLACAPLSSTAEDYKKARNTPVFRLHVAGPQEKKVATIEQFLPLVKHEIEMHHSEEVKK